jgi:hypothetical protein
MVFLGSETEGGFPARRLLRAGALKKAHKSGNFHVCGQARPRGWPAWPSSAASLGEAPEDEVPGVPGVPGLVKI